MKNRFSHISPWLFLFFLLLPMVSLLLLQGGQWYLQNTAGRRMQHHEVITVSMPEAQVVWHKRGKELSINGKLFDVKNYRLSGGTLTATGLYDDEEINLLTLLSKIVSPEKHQALLRFLLLLQCFAAPLLLFSIGRLKIKKPVHQEPFSPFLPQPFCWIAEQPPRC